MNGFWIGLGLALIAGALYRLTVVLAALVAAWTPAAWWAAVPAPPPALPSVIAAPTSAGEQAAEMAAAVAAGVEDLRELYAARGQARTDDELTAEVLDLLRTTMDHPDD